ncbi:hypothetical protein AWV80_37310 [Cupriavidus sp. UYMU48A]|nr:hypothetical protein AWV80_37310 [Cupriavidus sp. UYMU48A]
MAALWRRTTTDTETATTAETAASSTITIAIAIAIMETVTGAIIAMAATETIGKAGRGTRGGMFVSCDGGIQLADLERRKPMQLPRRHFSSPVLAPVR